MTVLELSRWQFGITTVYHFIFVPLTIGLAPLIAIAMNLPMGRQRLDDMDQKRPIGIDHPASTPAPNPSDRRQLRRFQ